MAWSTSLRVLVHSISSLLFFLFWIVCLHLPNSRETPHWNLVNVNIRSRITKLTTTIVQQYPIQNLCKDLLGLRSILANVFICQPIYWTLNKEIPCCLLSLFSCSNIRWLSNLWWVIQFCHSSNFFCTILIVFGYVTDLLHT